MEGEELIQLDTVDEIVGHADEADGGTPIDVAARELRVEAYRHDLAPGADSTPQAAT